MNKQFANGKTQKRNSISLLGEMPIKTTDHSYSSDQKNNFFKSTKTSSGEAVKLGPCTPLTSLFLGINKSTLENSLCMYNEKCMRIFIAALM